MQDVSFIEFSTENWGPFKEKATFSMSARKKDGHTFSANKENLLKTSLIYGPNASGKSSLLEAFRDLKRTVLSSANTKEDIVGISKLPYNPFLGSKDASSKPTCYELVFSLEGTKNDGVYRYSFSVLIDKIAEEELVEIQENGSERMLIERLKNNKISTDSNFKEIHEFLSKQDNLRSDALFLSMSAQANNSLAVDILSALRKINVISGLDTGGYMEFTKDQFKENKVFREKVLKYLKQADFCINGGEVKDVNPEDSSSRLKKLITIFFTHPVFNNKTEEIDSFEIPLEKESEGTSNFFHKLGPIIDTIENSKILFIDELDNSLHPLLTKFIVELFESEEVNKKHAQLIATTHDVSLLSNKKFIKDQFWFTEKDECGAAKLFSLAEFAGSDLRNDTGYLKKYLEGRFGALPVVGMVTE